MSCLHQNPYHAVLSALVALRTWEQLEDRPVYYLYLVQCLTHSRYSANSCLVWKDCFLFWNLHLLLFPNCPYPFIPRHSSALLCYWKSSWGQKCAGFISHLPNFSAAVNHLFLKKFSSLGSSTDAFWICFTLWSAFTLVPFFMLVATALHYSKYRGGCWWWWDSYSDMLVAGSLGEKGPDLWLLSIPWCKDSHQDWFQATNILMTSSQHPQVFNNWLSRAYHWVCRDE